MSKYKLRDGTPVEIIGPGPLTNKFKNVLPKGQVKPYLVLAENLCYRFDDIPHHKDVIEVKEA